MIYIYITLVQHVYVMYIVCVGNSQVPPANVVTPTCSERLTPLMIYMYITLVQHMYGMYILCVGNRVGYAPQGWSTTPRRWREQGKEDRWHWALGPRVSQSRPGNLVWTHTGECGSLCLSPLHPSLSLPLHHNLSVFTVYAHLPIVHLYSIYRRQTTWTSKGFWMSLVKLLQTW